MRITESVDLSGRLTIARHDRRGQIETYRFRNSIVVSGRDLVANLFGGAEIQSISHVAVGTGTTPVTPEATALERELWRKDLGIFDPDSQVATTSEGRVKVTLKGDFEFGEGNGALTEAGLFNADAETGGVMYNRVTFPPINKTEDFKLTLIWEITF